MVPKSPLESVRKRFQFAIDEIIEPCTPKAIAHMEKSEYLPHMEISQILKDVEFWGRRKRVEQRGC